MILASYIRPFDAKQKIYVLNDNNKDNGAGRQGYLSDDPVTRMN